MEQALYTLLTDVEARDAEKLDIQLSQELSVGAYWFD